MSRCEEYAECGNCQCTGADGHEGDHDYTDQEKWNTWWETQ